MRLLYRHCAGLDVHKKSISACVRSSGPGGAVEIATAQFGTVTAELERLAKWLRKHKVKNVAMESTGVYWIPVWNVLEDWRDGVFQLLLVNPQQVRALPGQKTDQEDCQRIAELHQYGLLRGSFVPPKPVRTMRDLTRRRVHLQQDRNRLINRIGRLLETANVKLGSVISNIVGKSGSAILEAMARGVKDPEKLAGRKVSRLSASDEELTQSLEGRYDDHFRWLLRELLGDLRHLDEKLAVLDARIGELMRPHLGIISRLMTIPGVDYTTACTLLAEIGLDMSVFPDASHLASWAGLCPGNCESAGKRQSGRTRKGNRYLRRALIQSGWAAGRSKEGFLMAVFFRVAGHRGMKRAAMAVAHKILVIAYHVIRDGVEYREMGGDFFDRRNPERTARRLARRLDRIGFAVIRKSKSEPDKRSLEERLGAAEGCLRCARWGIACIHVRRKHL
jgi:transposase